MNFSSPRSLAMIKFLIIVLVEHTDHSKSLETGSLDFFPAKGSLIIPEQNEEAALEGAPGRTIIVGNPTTRLAGKYTGMGLI